MSSTALLDANVLHPMVLCDLLIRLALAGYYRPLWSRKILDETVRSIHRRRPDLAIDLLQRRVDAMNRVFPDAVVTGYDDLLAELPALGKDAHVLAAAVSGGADVIVTHNVRDFPAALIDRYQVIVQTPDEFLGHHWRRAPEAVARILLEQSAGTRAPHLRPREILDRLRPMAPEFVHSALESNKLPE